MNAIDKVILAKRGLEAILRKQSEIAEKIAALYELFRSEFMSRAQAPGSLRMLLRNDCDPHDLYWAVYKGPQDGPFGGRATNFRRVGTRLTAKAIYSAGMGDDRKRLYWFDGQAEKLREERKRLVSDLERIKRLAAPYVKVS